MSRKKLVIYMVIILILYSGIVFYVLRDDENDKIDVVAVNDIAETLAEQWGSFDKDHLPYPEYGMDYVILNQNDQFISATRKGLNEELNLAITNRDTIVDIKSGGRILGKLMIYNTAGNQWDYYRNCFIKISIVFIILLIMYFLVYTLWINRVVLRPFQKLQGFAHHVAAGQLDMPLEMDKNNLFGAFTESFDLMREELYRARENERIANQSKKELVASLSHDIKTPIASIKAVTEVMYAKSGNENDKKQLEIINTKADQINTLITNMFTATLEELQELKVAPSEQSSQLLYDLIKLADYNQLVSISRIPECLILADMPRLAQVVDNVISNSYKYAGTPIHVSSEIKEKYLEIAFWDEGPGVAEEEKPLLFHKYYRAKNSRDKSGTGLGLYISKYLMNKMSGDIQCGTVKQGFIIVLKLYIP